MTTVTGCDGCPAIALAELLHGPAGFVIEDVVPVVTAPVHLACGPSLAAAEREPTEVDGNAKTETNARFVSTTIE